MFFTFCVNGVALVELLNSLHCVSAELATDAYFLLMERTTTTTTTKTGKPRFYHVASFLHIFNFFFLSCSKSYLLRN